MFSIVIPCFNKQNQILITLNSVLNQSFQDYEIIIVDDGSTDSSIEIIQQLNDTRIKLLQQTNSGVSVARNKAIENANGEWIAFLDADDWWHPQYLENIHNAISIHTGAQAISSGFFCKPDSPNWQPDAWPLPRQLPKIEEIKNLPERWLQGIPFFTSSICINSAFLKTIHPWFPKGESNGEDLDLWMRIAEKSSILHLPVEMVVYRTEQQQSLTGNHASLENPPFINRMQSRAHKKDFPPQLKDATLLFSAQHKLSRAREAILLQKRHVTLKLLINATYAIKTKRWWMTLFMCLLLPRSYVQKWQNNRNVTKELIQ